MWWIFVYKYSSCVNCRMTEYFWAVFDWTGLPVKSEAL